MSASAWLVGEEDGAAADAPSREAGVGPAVQWAARATRAAPRARESHGCRSMEASGTGVTVKAERASVEVSAAKFIAEIRPFPKSLAPCSPRRRCIASGPIGGPYLCLTQMRTGPAQLRTVPFPDSPGECNRAIFGKQGGAGVWGLDGSGAGIAGCLSHPCAGLAVPDADLKSRKGGGSRW